MGRDPLRRFGDRQRRALAAGLAALAAWVAATAGSGSRAATVAVLVAARELPAGRPLGPADLRAVGLPAGVVPAGALRPGARVLGRLVAGPVRRGEPLTDVRLVGPALLAGNGLGRDAVAVPVRLADPAAAALLHPGAVVDVLAESDGAARVVAPAVRVLAVPATSEPADPDPGGGGLIVVGCTEPTARALAAAAGARLSVAVRTPP